MGLIQAVTKFFYTKTPGIGDGDYSLNKTRVLAVGALFTAMGGALIYRYHPCLKDRIRLSSQVSATPLPIPPSQAKPRVTLASAALAHSEPVPISSVVTDSLKGHFPDIESLLQDIQKQIQTSIPSASYQLHDQSGQVLQIAVKIDPMGGNVSRLIANVSDPFPQQEICDAIEKIVPNKVTLHVSVLLPPGVNPSTPTPVSFPSDLTLGVQPTPETLLSAVENQLQQKDIQQSYSFYRKGTPVGFGVALRPENYIGILTEKNFRSDPLYPAFVNALKAIVYKQEGKYPTFVFFYSNH